MLTTGQKEPFLDFLRELVVEMFNQHGKNPTRKRNSCPGVGVDARFDGLNHWIGSTEEQNGKPQRRNCKNCANEGKRDMKTVLLCEKCQVPLHVHCFKEKIHALQFQTDYFFRF
jgi:hypothetical protein